MKDKRVILVPIDFTQICDRAVRQAHSISKALTCDMVLFHVIEQNTGWFSVFSRKKQKKKAGDSITNNLEELRVRAEKHSGQSVTTEVVSGKPYEKILQRATELNADFIVMGVREDDSGSVENHDVGYNVNKVVSKSDCPVITVSNKVTCHNLRSILLPLNLTRETRQKVTNAIRLAHLFRAKIKVMSALLTKHDNSVINQLTTQINQVVDFISEAGIVCEGELVESSGDARSEAPIILNYAQQQKDIDMILIMTRSEDLLDFIITPRAMDMLKNSPYPVMSIRPKTLERIWNSH